MRQEKGPVKGGIRFQRFESRDENNNDNLALTGEKRRLVCTGRDDMGKWMQVSKRPIPNAPLKPKVLDLHITWYVFGWEKQQNI